MEKCYLCKKRAEWEVQVDKDLRFSHQGIPLLVCEEHKQSISLDQPSYVKRFTKSLTEAYMDPLRASSFARCPNCQSVFKDDVMVWGSLICPYQECKGVALERGIKKLDEK